MRSVSTPSLKSAGQFLTDEAREAIEALRSCVVPLFDADEDGKAQLLGSAVLIELERVAYMLIRNQHCGDNSRIRFW